MRKDNQPALDKMLLDKSFEYNELHYQRYQNAQIVAEHYGVHENAIAVLSNLNAKRSYIYYGHVADGMGIARAGRTEEINSIWEDKILEQLHPDDRLEKHAWELKFISFIESLPIEVRHEYFLQHVVRMRQETGEYMFMLHRVMYLDYDAHGYVVLALCLYTRINSRDLPCVGIVNTSTGQLVESAGHLVSELLSEREKEILRLIGDGLASKMIAERLFISTHTVNRHRQNILQKLQVSNSSEAFCLAKRLGII